MTGSKISDTTYIPLIDAQRKGYIRLSVSNYDNDFLPVVLKGSQIYYNGDLYVVYKDEEIRNSGYSEECYVIFNGLYFKYSTAVISWDADNFYYSNSEGRIVMKLYIDSLDYKNKRYVTNWRQDDTY